MSNKINFKGKRESSRKRGGGKRNGVKHSGRFRERTSRGLSNGFKGSERQSHGDPFQTYGAPTKRSPWMTRTERRAANKIAKASRKANRS